MPEICEVRVNLYLLVCMLMTVDRLRFRISMCCQSCVGCERMTWQNSENHNNFYSTGYAISQMV